MALSKTILIFYLEDVLIPGKINPHVKPEETKALLEGMKSYQKEHPELKTYLLSTLQEQVFKEKVQSFQLGDYFDSKHQLSVDEAYLSTKAPVDKELYEKRCAEDPHCKDEYFRQVQMQEILKQTKEDPSKVLLVGHDYWFDGFYTRRFAQVDMAFMQDALSSRDKPVTEKIEGVWYVSRVWEDIQALLEGKKETPNYKPLDTFVTTTIAEELLGGKGYPVIKRVVLERQRQKSGVS